MIKTEWDDYIHREQESPTCIYCKRPDAQVYDEYLEHYYCDEECFEEFAENHLTPIFEAYAKIYLVW